MKELSVFVDESGDYGKYTAHSPYYIITMVFHNQSVDLAQKIKNIEIAYSMLGYSNHCLHVGPVIRKEEVYSFVCIEDRRKLVNIMISFILSSEISYKCFWINKKHIENTIEAVSRLTKLMKTFIYEHFIFFLAYDKIKVYYDNGQVIVLRMLYSVLTVLLQNVIFRKILPSSYRLFQVADLICSFKLISIKADNKLLSKSEQYFFPSIRNLKKYYLDPLKRKELR